MMEIDSYIDTVLETSNLAEVFDIIYNSGGCVEAFHAKHGSRNFRVLQGWEDGARTLSYSVAIPVPAVLASIIGDDVNIKESQRVTWVSVGGSTIPDPLESASTGLSSGASSASDLQHEPPIGFTVTCVPKLETGGDKFVTELAFSYRRRAAGMGGGVRVVCSLKVEAKVWGLQSTIEPLMMSEARKTLSEFFPFMAEYFHMRGGVAMVPASLPSIEDETAASNISTMTTLNPEECFGYGSEAEVFFDAEESVPKGVRAAVQLFEGGQVSAKRPVFRSRSPSPSSKISRLRIPSVLETNSGPQNASEHKSPLGLLRNGLASRWQPTSEIHHTVDGNIYDDPHSSFRQRRFSTPVARSTSETFVRDRTHLHSATGSSTASAFDAGATSPRQDEGSEVDSNEHLCSLPSARQSEPCLLHHNSCQTDPLITHHSEPDIRQGAQAGGYSFEDCSTAFESVAEDSITTMPTVTQEEHMRMTLEFVHVKLGAAEQRIEELSARLEECVSLVHTDRIGSESGLTPRKFSSVTVTAGFVLGVAVGVGAVLGVLWGRQQGLATARRG